MFKNYLKTTWRNLRRNKLFSIVNIFGLSLALLGGLICFSYVAFHRSFDQSFATQKATYRITTEWFQDGAFLEHRAAAVPAMYQVFDASFPTITKHARYHRGAVNIVRANEDAPNERVFEEDQVYYADPSFLEMFNIEFARGNSANALDAPNKVILTERIARKYFGDANPLGEVLQFNGEFDFRAEVTGVIKALPEKSHFEGEMILSLATKVNLVPVFNIPDNWIWRSFYTYVSFENAIDMQAFQTELNTTINNRLGSFYSDRGYKVNFHVQELTGIHTSAPLFEDMKANVPEKELSYVTLIGLLLILIAAFNYVNLSTAKNLKRAKEVGVRKVIGAQKQQLIGQFLLESAAVNAISVALALSLFFAARTTIGNFLGLELDVSIFQNTTTLVLLFGGWLLLSALSGFYPAWVLSRMAPVKVLKSGASNARSGLNFRKVLVSVQVIASLGLIMALYVVNRQLQFSMNRDLGIARENVLVIKGPKIKADPYSNQLDLFKNRVESQAGISFMSTVSSLPGEVTSAGRDFRNAEGMSQFLRILRVEYDFDQVFDLEFVAGQNYHPERPSDNEGLVINESAARQMGYSNVEDIIGQTLRWRNTRETIHSRVVGVVKDYYPHAQSAPVATAFILNRSFSAPWDEEFYALKVSYSSPEQLAGLVKEVNEVWNSVFSQDPFNHFFVEEFVDRQLETDRLFSKILSSFSMGAFLIALIGLLALAAFINQLRMKEVGIRKVLGSSRWNAVILLMRQYAMITFLALLIALPLAYFILGEWLNSFAFSIELGVLPLLGLGLGVVLTVLVLIGVQVFRATSINPVKVLRSE